jgi:hypothetical protein
MGVALIISSCAADGCTHELNENYPEIISFLEENELTDHTDVTCASGGHQSYTFNGYEEPDNKCHFFDVSLEVGAMAVDTFTFYKDDTRLFDIIAYQFDQSEDRDAFVDFIPDASLFYNKHKEIHEYFVGEDYVYLKYVGFP